MSAPQRTVRLTSCDSWERHQDKAAIENAIVLSHMKRFWHRDWTGQEMRESLLKHGGPDLPIGSISRIFGALAKLQAIEQDEDHKRKCSITGKNVMARRLLPEFKQLVLV